MTQLRSSMGFVHLDVPGDQELLKAVGRVALAHGQLELILRMTFKSIKGLSVKDALNRTKFTSVSKMRKRVLDAFKNKSDDFSFHQLKRLMDECERLSKRRNKMIHNTWAIHPVDTSIVVKGDDHAWGSPPTVEDLHTLAFEIQSKVEELNHARLHGFIKNAIKIHGSR